MAKSNNRTAAEGEYVAFATRRRRRILQAGFFFIALRWSGDMPLLQLAADKEVCKQCHLVSALIQP
jgi:hypothetical protein